MYISGGENIYPQEIECIENWQVSKRHWFYQEDQKNGACSIAFVTYVEITGEKVHDFLKANLADYKNQIHFILDEIPLTSLGKVSVKNYMNILTH
jgi:acyl-CoA synthetase (AMP-forming)/AMP-acid ligase II